RIKSYSFSGICCSGLRLRYMISAREEPSIQFPQVHYLLKCARVLNRAESMGKLRCNENDREVSCQTKIV
ncbi:hypothetical protein MUP77_23960, partial [Candidatus Bathyarchaeota archaeon]|nr:hypothetical protein [Candidatus Bathyarchaeota archaeon]